ncbi:hypothetical protein K443DRAFT_9990 [Laccaria amethystina LaAM-08-1]|uniref:Uncharacterized protein n=1 Tax=Laccaria amethystina LaAM-08-1 TaxID=1095629 RepID=A0A0C9WLK7_9AGAR|nr:hypothetical protein K443DRAFT_9990 [Laccaria amethystina LaAM-08-1]
MHHPRGIGAYASSFTSLPEHVEVGRVASPKFPPSSACTGLPTSQLPGCLEKYEERRSRVHVGRLGREVECQNHLGGFKFLLNDDSIPRLVRLGFFAPAVQIRDNGTLHVEPPRDSCQVVRVCPDMLKGIGIEGRWPADIEVVKNIHFECTYHFRLTLINEGPMPILAAIFLGLPGRALPPVTTMAKMMSHRTLPRLPKGKDGSSFRQFNLKHGVNVAPRFPPYCCLVSRQREVEETRRKRGRREETGQTREPGHGDTFLTPIDSDLTPYLASNESSSVVTALRMALLICQEALDQCELGLVARQERIEGINERVREVQRAVGYREEAVG